jgi:hypothetical protein
MTSEDLGTDQRVIFKWILKIQGRRLWTGFIWLRKVTPDWFL